MNACDRAVKVVERKSNADAAGLSRMRGGSNEYVLDWYAYVGYNSTTALFVCLFKLYGTTGGYQYGHTSGRWGGVSSKYLVGSLKKRYISTFSLLAWTKIGLSDTSLEGFQPFFQRRHERYHNYMYTIFRRTIYEGRNIAVIPLQQHENNYKHCAHWNLLKLLRRKYHNRR